MNAKPLLVATFLLASLLPLAPVASAWTCVPGQDLSAKMVGVLGNVYYQKLYESSGYLIEEVWQETNGEKGLQTSASMSCGGKADKLVREVCIGWCPFGI